MLRMLAIHEVAAPSFPIAPIWTARAATPGRGGRWLQATHEPPVESMMRVNRISARRLNCHEFRSHVEVCHRRRLGGGTVSLGEEREADFPRFGSQRFDVCLQPSVGFQQPVDPFSFSRINEEKGRVGHDVHDRTRRVTPFKFPTLAVDMSVARVLTVCQSTASRCCWW